MFVLRHKHLLRKEFNLSAHTFNIVDIIRRQHLEAVVTNNNLLPVHKTDTDVILAFVINAIPLFSHLWSSFPFKT